jgi:hypothetical protein
VTELSYTEAVLAAARSAHEATRAFQLTVMFDQLPSGEGSDWWEVTRWEDLSKPTIEALFKTAVEVIENLHTPGIHYRAQVTIDTWQALKPYVHNWPARCR